MKRSLAALASLVLLVPAASTAGSTRQVRIALSDVGKATWSTVGDEEKGTLTMSYRWSGTFTFKVSGSRLFSRVAGTIVGTWRGEASGTRFSEPNAGEYHCTYSGSNVAHGVLAELGSGPGKGHVHVVLLSRRGTSLNGPGFFPNKGEGATAECTSAFGAEGPSHFPPSTLFRDTISDNGRFTSAQATLVLPSAMLPHGSAKTNFPHEVGSVHSPLRARLDWSNNGRLTATAR